MAETLASKIDFPDLCTLFETISKTKNHAEKYEQLSKFIRSLRKEAAELKSHDPNMDVSLFCIYRLILPNLERERKSLELKETRLSSLYAKVFALSKDIEKSLTGNKPQTGASGNDFSEKIFYLLKNRLKAQTKVTVETVNNFLDKVAKCRDSNEKYNIFNNFIQKISATELMWLTRIILKDLKIGVTQSKVFKTIHPEAEEAYNAVTNLREICKRYSQESIDDNSEIIDLQIKLFYPFKPMLLEKREFKKCKKLFKRCTNYYVQNKYDGERSQLHMKDLKFKWYTRNGFDITNNPGYGDSIESGGIMSTKITSLINKTCKSFILDGELMGWIKKEQKFASKGHHFDVKKITEQSEYQPCFVAYDIVYYNDQVLTEKPYSERFEILKTVFKEQKGVLMMTENTILNDELKFLKRFQEAFDREDEGVVLKREDSTYQPNERHRSGCYKVKNEYSKDLIQGMDLIILGGFYGQGRYAGSINAFLVGVMHTPTNKTNTPSEFSSLCIVSNMKEEKLKILLERLKPYWQENKPNLVHAAQGKDNTPNLWIPPKHSVILEVTASEIELNKKFPLGYTLRFAVISEIRYDKPWFNAESEKEFRDRIKDKENQINKLAKRPVTKEDYETDDENDDGNDDIGKKKSKRKCTGNAKGSILQVDSKFQSKQNEEVSHVSRLFDGKEFCVLTGTAALSKEKICLMIKQHHGNIVANPKKNIFCVIVGDTNNLKVTNLMGKNEYSKYDLVKVGWLERVTKDFPKKLEFYPWELLKMTPKTYLKIRAFYDDYYDSYTEPATIDSLKRSLEKLDEVVTKGNTLDISEVKQLNKLLFGIDVSPFLLFKDVNGYFFDKEDEAIHSFKFMGGTVIHEVPKPTTGYIFISDFVNKGDVLHIKEKEKSALFLKSCYVEDCCDRKDILPVADYIFNI